MKLTNTIKIIGAKEHNLKNVSFEIPRNKLTSIVGISGSGKSTIAFDIIFSEGQRQYLESSSTYASRFLQRTGRADIDGIEGLSSTIMIEQRQLGNNPRSTVGTTTELYTYLRLLFSRVGSKKLSAGHFSFNNPKGACKKCKGLGVEYNIDPHAILDFDKSLNDGASKLSNYKPGARYFNIINTSGKLNMDKPIKDYSEEELDFLLYSPRVVLSNKDQGFIQTFSHEGIIKRLIGRAKDLRGQSERKKKAEGNFWITYPCSECNGTRVNKEALAVKINNKNIGDFAQLPINSLIKEIKKVDGPLAQPIIERMLKLLQSLIDIGIGYVSLNRSVNTLSGGEAQRIKLARELGSDLIETIYILDEPTIGLHPKDVDKIIKSLKQLRDSQNTVIVVEHDPAVISISDYILEVGPGAGRFGGEIIASGKLDDIIKNQRSITGPFLNNRKSISSRKQMRKPNGFLEIKKASLNNLKNIDVKIPTGVLTIMTGVSGAGKSSLSEVFVKQYYNKVTSIDQKPVGASPRGNSATYTRAFDLIRDIFAKENDVSKAFFSSNSKGGCPDCNGLGYEKIDMHFLGDVKIACETCKGKKYLPEVLEYKVNNKNIYQVLEMTVEEAVGFFDNKELDKKLSMLMDVGLDYLQLGQPLNTLSGGEAQRVKLAKELNKKGEFYVLDEPTKGLHLADIEKLLLLLNKLVDKGNSVLVIEHNLDIIKNADWIIDLGPDGGERGGQLVAEGTPEDIIRIKESYTGQYLNKVDK